jgi:hypothetical protein
MGDDAGKLRVLIPTTAGPAEVLLLTEEDSAVGRSVACIGGTTDTADIAAAYHAFVARPTGIVESLFGHSCYRLDVSARIDAGTSWQLGVLAAHALHATGRLAQENDRADGVVWATGTVRSVDLTVGGVSHIPEKIAGSLPRLEQEAQASRRVLVAIPVQNAALLSADLRSKFAAGGIEVLELDRVQPLWDALAIKLPEAPRKVAWDRAGGVKVSPSPRGRLVLGAAAAVLLGVAAVTAYLLVRPPAAVVELGADAAPSLAGSENSVLVPELVPYISQEEQAKIRSVYLPAPDHKALAVNFNRIFVSAAQADEKSAAAAAISVCQQITEANGGDPGRCDLYATGNIVVSRRGRPPMPLQPWFVRDPSIERSFVAADFPLASEADKKTMEMNYATRRSPKALALSPTGTISGDYGETSVDQAVRRALEFCGYNSRTACMIIAVDDAFVVPIPKSVKVVGFFRADALDAVLPELRRDVARQLGSATSGWSALAIGAGGVVGIELGAQSEEAAIDGSVQACLKQVRDCRVAVIGPFLVERGP